MSVNWNSLADSTRSIRAKSEGLENINTAEGTLQQVKSVQSKIDEAYSRLMIRVNAQKSICGFLNIEPVIDWSEVGTKLANSKKWLANGANDWDITTLNELLLALTSMINAVQSSLSTNWSSMVARIGVAKTRLGFIDTVEANVLERNLRPFDVVTQPQSMDGAIDALKEAEALIAIVGVGNAKVEKFLENASSLDGVSLDSVNEPEVKSWLDEDNRREKFVIRFKGRGH